MEKLFIDCNILIDWLTDREPHSIFASKLISLIEREKVKGYISPIILTNTYYILSKQFNKKLAYEFIIDCKMIFEILDITKGITEEAIIEKYRDFEDDLHFQTAKKNTIGTIITRNKKDYRVGDVDILTAEEYIKRYKEN